VSNSWNTFDEIQFIETLGTYGKAKLSRPQLLEKYKESIKDRVVWVDGEGTNIDKDEIVAYLNGLVKVEKGKGPRGHLKLKGEED